MSGWWSSRKRTTRSCLGRERFLDASKEVSKEVRKGWPNKRSVFTVSKDFCRSACFLSLGKQRRDDLMHMGRVGQSSSGHSNRSAPVGPCGRLPNRPVAWVSWGVLNGSCILPKTTWGKGGSAADGQRDRTGAGAVIEDATPPAVAPMAPASISPPSTGREPSRPWSDRAARGLVEPAAILSIFIRWGHCKGRRQIRGDRASAFAAPRPGSRLDRIVISVGTPPSDRAPGGRPMSSVSNRMIRVLSVQD